MAATAISIKDPIHNLVQEGLLGLCETCIHKTSCVYRIQSNKIILQCELFEIGKANNLYAHRNDWEYKELKVNSRKGLCSNCLNEPHCQLPKANGGVWHCEEYF
ncbi:MAG: hypothetical protein RIF39_06820 [Cyclobacteriaceae bacterium]